TGSRRNSHHVGWGWSDTPLLRRRGLRAARHRHPGELWGNARLARPCRCNPVQCGGSNLLCHGPDHAWGEWSTDRYLDLAYGDSAAVQRRAAGDRAGTADPAVLSTRLGSDCPRATGRYRSGLAGGGSLDEEVPCDCPIPFHPRGAICRLNSLPLQASSSRARPLGICTTSVTSFAILSQRWRSIGEWGSSWRRRSFLLSPPIRV